MTKILGILGGMGPLATVKLFENIVLMTKANSDQEHIPILVDNNIFIPDRTDYILDNNSLDPRGELIKSALRLENMGADYLVMPCNTAYYFYDEIVENINIPFLNMIEEAAKYIGENFNGTKKIGLLATEGTIKAKIYDKVFKRYGIEVIKPSPENQIYVTQLIYNIKEDIIEQNLDGFYKAIDELKSQDIEILVAGCTEISVAIDLYDLEGNIIDPMKIIALRAIEFAGKKAKDI